MTKPGLQDRLDQWRSEFSADRQWVATYAWGLAFAGAILAALIAWAMFGSDSDVSYPERPAQVAAPTLE